MPKRGGGSVPDVSKVPVPESAGVGKPPAPPVNIIVNSAVSSQGVSPAGIKTGPYSNLGAIIENKGGFDILKFNMAPGSSIVTNQETLSYMDGGLSTQATTGSSGIFGALFRGVTGASFLQNIVVNSTQNILKMVLSPLVQGSVVQVDIKPGETWRFADKSFMACTPNMSVSGNLNIFSNFRMMFIGENLTYTTVSANQGTAGSVWVSCYGAVEKHEINMGSGSTVPLFINNGCFLGMLDNDGAHNYWNEYVSVGTANGLFNAMFTQLGWVMKIQESNPPRGVAKCVVLTQSMNPHNFEKYIANIAQKVVEQNKTTHSSGFLTSGVGPTARTAVLGTAAATAATAGTAAPLATASEPVPVAPTPIVADSSAISTSPQTIANASPNTSSGGIMDMFATAPAESTIPENPTPNVVAEPDMLAQPNTSQQSDNSQQGGSKRLRRKRRNVTIRASRVV
jgi:uncharacterized protein (AIM24 family)